MKKPIFTLLLALCFSALFGQSNNLQHVIVMMAERYDDSQLSQKTALMTKEQRRDFVIAERKAFCQASQVQVLDFLNGYKSENLVSDLKTFWSFNGFSCSASAEVIAQLAQRKNVAMIIPDEMRQMIPQNEMVRPVNTRANAWHVDKINAPAVWNYNSSGYTGNGVIIGHIDTGVNYNHIDIANSMWDGGNEFPHHGYDIFYQDNDPMDDDGHGTHTAGILAGQGTAGTQTGIAPGAKIMSIKVLGEDGQGEATHLIQGVEFALEHGAHILSLSLSDVGAGPCYYYRDVFTTCLEAGVAAAVACGNEGQTQYTFPVPFNISAPGNCPPAWLHPDQRNLIEGGLTSVISVGATDSNDEHCGFSSVGPTTWAAGSNVGNYNDYPYENGDVNQPGLIRPDISAPGANITSLNYQTTNGYTELDGTSMATPCVAGVLAMLLEANPELSPAELDSIIELTSVRVGNTMKNNRVGSGRIDALAAMNALFHHGPTNLTADFDGEQVVLNWTAAPEGISYDVYRDGMRIANSLTATTYTDHISYAGSYTYYIIAHLGNDMISLPSNYVTLTKPVEIEVEVINNMRVSLSWNLPAGIYDGFESGDFYQNMWINDATSPWGITTTQPNTGTYCAKSTNTGMFSNSKISLAVNLPTSCVVSYYARVSCFPLNGCGFFIDNVQYGETLKDEVPWTRYTVAIGPGNHILEWKYANQLAEGEYDNAFYIDDITVGNTYSIYRANCDGSNAELIASNVADAHYVDYGWDALPIGQYKYGISTDGGNTIAWSDCLDKDVMVVDENNAMEIKVYPNPTNGILFVETVCTPSLPSATEYIITNVAGQTLLSGHITDEIQHIDVTGLAEGMYFVRIQGDEGITIKKFCIVK
jgi:subtilisin family serine protease